MSPYKLRYDSLPRRESLQASTVSSSVSSSSSRLPTRSAVPATRSNVSSSAALVAKGQSKNAAVDPVREIASSSSRSNNVTVRPSSRSTVTLTPVSVSGARGSAGQRALNTSRTGQDESSRSKTYAPTSRRESRSVEEYDPGDHHDSAELFNTNNADSSLKSAAKSSAVQRQLSSPPTSAPQPHPSHTGALGLSLPSSTANMVSESASPIIEPHKAPIYNSENLPVPLQALSQSLTPPTPLYALSTTPSTFCSDSPGPFSHSSTPTSMSSHSPGVAFPARLFHKSKDDSPSRSGPSALLTGQRTDDLSHQSYNSSSSNSTIKAGERDTSRQRHFSAQLQNTLQSSSRSANSSPAKPSSSSDTKAKIHNNDISVDKAQVPDLHSTGPAQAPPELAHLATATPQVLHSRVPSRPSRAGTAVLDLREPSPIIQSNMSRLPVSHHRRASSSDSRTSGLGLTTSPRGLKALKPGHKLPTNSSDLSLSDVKTSTLRRPSTQDSDADRPTSGRGRAKLKKENTAPPPQSSPSNKQKSRLGFLTRSRKGPAAGTGHEGYGKYSLRRRSGSNVGIGVQGRSPSADSVASSSYGYASSRKSSISSEHEDPSMDCFLRERLSPVIIRGEGTAARISNSSASQDGWNGNGVLGGWSTMTSSVTSLESTASAARDTSKLTLLPSAMAREQIASPQGKHHDGRSEYDAYVETDAPVSPKTVHPPATVTSKNNGKTQWPMLERTISQESGNPADMSSKAIKEKQSRIKPLHKWNFFQRAQNRTTNVSSKSAPSDIFADPDSPVSVARLQPTRTVPHYAMLEMPQSVDMQDLERLMQEADVSQEESSYSVILDDSSKEVDGQQFEHGSTVDNPEEKETKKEHVQSVLLPSPPSFMMTFSHSRNEQSIVHGEGTDNLGRDNKKLDDNPHSTNAAEITAVPTEQPNIHAEHPASMTPDLTSASPLKPSRLAQIGRIPKVVSKRDRERKLPSQSFSRPFAPSQPRPQLQPPVLSNTVDRPRSKGWAQGMVQDQVAIDVTQEQRRMTDNVVEHLNGSQPTLSSAQDTEFLSFSPRKNSDMSYTSSSGGYSIFSSPAGALQIANANGVSEDEVWREYDDLLDEVALPKLSTVSKVAPSSAPSRLPPVPSKSARRSRRGRKGKKPAAAKLDGGQLRVNDKNIAAAAAVDESEAGSLSCAGSWCGSDLPLSRKTKLLSGSSNVLPAAGISPGTPMSVTDLLATYEDRNLSGCETEFESEDDDNTSHAKTGKAREGSALDEAITSSHKKRTSLLTHSTSYSHVAGSGVTGATTVSEQETSLTSVTQSSASALAISSGSGSSTTAEVAATSQVAAKYPDPKQVEEVENRNDGLVSMANLRFGALMTSKWLSFGQVLFSPAQSELAQSTGERVLVLDGLGTGKFLLELQNYNRS